MPSPETHGFVVDNSYSFPGADAILNSGAKGCIRYLSSDARGLTLAQMEACHALGLHCGVVWETRANRAGDGFDAGVQDAHQAEAIADRLAWPATRPIYYAVDFDAAPGQVTEYFRGVLSGARREVGVYGSYRIIEGLVGGGMVKWGWQCAAWSGNGEGSGGSIQGRRVSAHSHLFQRVGYVLGNTSDYNDILKPDWGGFHPGILSGVVSTPPKEDFDVRYIILDARVQPYGTGWLLVGTRKFHLDSTQLDILQHAAENGDANLKNVGYQGDGSPYILLLDLASEEQ